MVVVVCGCVGVGVCGRACFCQYLIKEIKKSLVRINGRRYLHVIVLFACFCFIFVIICLFFVVVVVAILRRVILKGLTSKICV